MVIICLSSGKCWIINFLFHFYPISCSKITDAWKRLLTCQSPLSLCIQIVRFQNDGKKIGNLIDYKEKVFFPEHHNSSDKGTTATDVSYQLRAVIVHEGTKISSDHYICYFKRGDERYYSSDATIRQSSALEATSQEAYLLFYYSQEWKITNIMLDYWCQICFEVRL